VFSFFLFVQDTVFSALVTALFLRPIYKVLSGADAAVQHSVGYKKLLKTKWMALAGASLAVASSTALYVNAGLFTLLGGYGTQFYASPYLNIEVFGMNLDSVLNDVGILLACGMLKTVSCASFLKCLSKPAFSSTSGVVPHDTGAHAEPSMVFTSQGQEGGV
jgi:hypothetical protein